MIRVVVTGSESTGKSTLAAALAAHHGAACVPEFAREFVLRKGAAPGAADVEAIARGQIALQEAAEAGMPPLLFLDTDLISTVVYARHYYGACAAWIEQEARRRVAHLYLLCAIDVPWAPDGHLRDRPSARAHLQSLFGEALRAFGARVHEIHGEPPTRLLRGIAAVEWVRSERHRERPGLPPDAPVR